jgi:hypothetical protein
MRINCIKRIVPSGSQDILYKPGTVSTVHVVIPMIVISSIDDILHRLILLGCCVNGNALGCDPRMLFSVIQEIPVDITADQKTAVWLFWASRCGTCATGMGGLTGI